MGFDLGGRTGQQALMETSKPTKMETRQIDHSCSLLTQFTHPNTGRSHGVQGSGQLHGQGQDAQVSKSWVGRGGVCLLGESLEAAHHHHHHLASPSLPCSGLVWQAQPQLTLTRPPLRIYPYRNPVVQLYRTISKELPRVLTIYDADLAPAEVRLSGRAGGRK